MIKAKKRYGQNFLKDQSVLTRIVESMPKNKNHLVEIGPGLGDLTGVLTRHKKVTVYEVDKDLVAILKIKFFKEIESKILEIFFTDILDVWKEKNTLYDSTYDLIANLPYYIATNIILKSFDDENCEHIIVMIQKEVADKFVAKTGNKNFSALSVIAQSSCTDIFKVVDVPPTAFEPQPKVNSCVVYFKKDRTKKVDKKFKKFLEICFAQPRKVLTKNLSAIIAKDKLMEIFQDLEILSNIRAHQIDTKMYHELFKRITNE